MSVVVATFNRARYLGDLIEAIGQQSLPTSRFELILVDDGSTDDTTGLVQTYRESVGFPMVYVRHLEQRGPAAARNTGVQHTRGELIAFTDSDCIPRPSWLKELVSAWSADIGVVTGPILPVFLTDKGIGKFYHQIAPSTREDAFFPTANALYSAASLREAGGFDETYNRLGRNIIAGGEDTDLAWRVLRLGFRSKFTPSAIVDHQASPLTFREWLMDGARAVLVPRLVAEYPEVRAHKLWLGLFVLRTHACIYGTTLLSAAAMVSGVSAPAIAAAGVTLLVFTAECISWGIVHHHLKNAHSWWRIPLLYGRAGVRLAVGLMSIWYGCIKYRVVVG